MFSSMGIVENKHHMMNLCLFPNIMYRMNVFFENSDFTSSQLIEQKTRNQSKPLNDVPTQTFLLHNAHCLIGIFKCILFQIISLFNLSPLFLCQKYILKNNCSASVYGATKTETRTQTKLKKKTLFINQNMYINLYLC